MTARKTPRKTAAAAPRKKRTVAKAEPPKKTPGAKATTTQRGRRPGTTPRKQAPGCMTPEQFRDEIFRRGWKITEVAKRWGMGGNWLYKLIANTERGLRWDDAVRGLPHLATQP